MSKRNNGPVVVFDGNGHVRYESISEAAVKLGCRVKVVLGYVDVVKLFRDKYLIRSCKDDQAHKPILSKKRKKAIIVKVKFAPPTRFMVPITKPRKATRYSCTCVMCGTQWSATKSRARYCSKACRERHKGNNPKVKFTCASCGKESERYNPPTWKLPKYCSVKCASQAVQPTTVRTKQQQYAYDWRHTENGKACRRKQAKKNYEKLKARKAQEKGNQE